MSARRPALGSIVAMLVPLVVGCSSGGNQSVPATSTTATHASLPGPVTSNSESLNGFHGPLVSRVPNVLGMRGAQALAMLSAKRFVVSSKGARCCTGVIVIGQTPSAGALLAPRTTVTLTLTPVSTGYESGAPTGAHG
jgi:hypothetical protein